jgi:hypothetical protein
MTKATVSGGRAGSLDMVARRTGTCSENSRYEFEFSTGASSEEETGRQVHTPL